MCDNRGLIFFLSFAILFSCSTQKTITSKNEERGYYEDLSILRSQEQPKKSIKEEKVISSNQVKNNISLELDTIIQIIRSESDNIKFLKFLLEFILTFLAFRNIALQNPAFIFPNLIFVNCTQ